jgi:hypothetical protein
MSEDVQEIIMTDLSLHELSESLPKTKGKYIIHINTKVVKKAIEYFEYDKFRVPQHKHFITYGKEYFNIDYIGHYLLPYVETKIVINNPQTNNLILQYQII